MLDSGSDGAVGGVGPDRESHGTHPDLDAQTSCEYTLLKGCVRDQAGLHGVLPQIEALGLELLEVRRVADDSPMDENR